MDKRSLLKHILDEVEALYRGAVDAERQAYHTATHDENVAENKYDTLGLEASYLAHGQAQRVAECRADLAIYKKLTATEYSRNMPVATGALLTLTDEQGSVLHLFLGPAAGGLKLTFDQREIMVITPAAPLGQALLGHYIDDEVEISIGGQKRAYEITAIA